MADVEAPLRTLGWVLVGWEGNPRRWRGRRTFLLEVGMGGCPAQGNSYEVGGLPTVAVFWNKWAPAGMGA